jgi:hypothetical protein
MRTPCEFGRVWLGVYKRDEPLRPRLRFVPSDSRWTNKPAGRQGAVYHAKRDGISCAVSVIVS